MKKILLFLVILLTSQNLHAQTRTILFYPLDQAPVAGTNLIEDATTPQAQSLEQDYPHTSAEQQPIPPMLGWGDAVFGGNGEAIIGIYWILE